MLMAWPNFMAPPLSSPRVRKICSAVRACISAATASADRPPTRLPIPSAARPAMPRGRAASRALRATVRRGRSLTQPWSHRRARRGAGGSGGPPAGPGSATRAGVRPARRSRTPGGRTTGATRSPRACPTRTSTPARRVRRPRRRERAASPAVDRRRGGRPGPAHPAGVPAQQPDGVGPAGVQVAVVQVEAVQAGPCARAPRAARRRRGRAGRPRAGAGCRPAPAGRRRGRRARGR